MAALAHRLQRFEARLPFRGMDTGFQLFRQTDWAPMRGGEVRSTPQISDRARLVRLGKAALMQHAFQRLKPRKEVVIATVELPADTVSGKGRAEGFGPFGPRQVSRLIERDRQGEYLGLPRLLKARLSYGFRHQLAFSK